MDVALDKDGGGGGIGGFFHRVLDVAGDHFRVAEEGEGETGSYEQRFTLGVDTLATKEPPAWVDVIAYGVSLLILGLLIVGVSRALARLPINSALETARP